MPLGTLRWGWAATAVLWDLASICCLLDRRAAWVHLKTRALSPKQTSVPTALNPLHPLPPNTQNTTAKQDHVIRTHGRDAAGDAVFVALNLGLWAADAALFRPYWAPASPRALVNVRELLAFDFVRACRHCFWKLRMWAVAPAVSCFLGTVFGDGGLAVSASQALSESVPRTPFLTPASVPPPPGPPAPCAAQRHGRLPPRHGRLCGGLQFRDHHGQALARGACGAKRAARSDARCRGAGGDRLRGGCARRRRRCGVLPCVRHRSLPASHAATGAGPRRWCLCAPPATQSCCRSATHPSLQLPAANPSPQVRPSRPAASCSGGRSRRGRQRAPSTPEASSAPRWAGARRRRPAAD